MQLFCKFEFITKILKDQWMAITVSHVPSFLEIVPLSLSDIPTLKKTQLSLMNLITVLRLLVTLNTSLLTITNVEHFKPNSVSH